MSERIQYRFSLKKEPSSIALINFLRQDDDTSARDKLLSALFTYWLPFAFKADGNYSQLELKQYARYAIYKLNLHITYLAQEFLTEDFSFCSPTIIPAKPMVQQVVSNAPISNVASESLIEPEPESPNSDAGILPNEYDGMLETMFVSARQKSEVKKSGT